ncbi:unnamed protein product, partial [Sphagnum compactum]
GGAYEKRWKDEGSEYTRYTANPSEISLVDLPCLPSATFKVIKADGMEVEKSFVSVEEQNVNEPEEEFETKIISKRDGSAHNSIEQLKAHHIKLEAEELAKQEASAALELVGSLSKTFGETTETAEATEVEKLEASVEELAKVGARNSKTDKERIQAVHDHACALGADCPNKVDDTDMDGKAAEITDLRKRADELEIVKEQLAKANALVAAKEAIITDQMLPLLQKMQKSIEALEAQPTPLPWQVGTKVISKNAQAEAMLAAAKNKVAAAQSYGKEAQTGAQNELVAAQKSVEEKTKALAIAQAEYELSQKPDSFKGTQEELEAKKQIIDIQRTGIVENSALDLQLQKQKQALQDAYDKQQIQNEKARGNLDLASMQPGNKATFQKEKDVASIGINEDSSEQDKIASATRLAEIQKQETDQKLANDKLAENTSYQLAMQTFQQKQQLFKSELAAKTLTKAQELVGEQELFQQEEALTTAHYKKLADLVKGNEQETIQIENQRILAIAALKNKEVEQNQAAQAKIQQ